MILILRPMNTGQTIGTIDGRRAHGLDSAKSVLQWRFQRRMPDMESGEKHHPIEAGQGVGALCQSTALRAWHRGLHWRNRGAGDLAGRAAAWDEGSGLAEMTKAPHCGAFHLAPHLSAC